MRRPLTATAVATLALLAGGCGDVASLPTPRAFIDCLGESDLRTAGADDAEGRHALMDDPRALACAAHDLDSEELRDALHGAFTRPQAYDAVRGFLDQQPSSRGAEALAEEAGSLYGGMADDDWRVQRPLQLFAWQAWTHENGVPESYDAWVEAHQAHVSESDPTAAVTGYLAASSQQQPDSEEYRTWDDVVHLQDAASRACRSVREAG